MRRLACLILLIGSIAAPTASHASIPSSHPDTFTYVTGPISNDFYVNDTDDANTSMLSVEITSADGHLSQIEYRFRYQGDDAAFRVRRDGDTQTITTFPAGSNRVVFDPEFFPSNEWATIRIGLATWGGTNSLHVQIDGVPAVPTQGDPSRVTIARPLEFSGGNGVFSPSIDAVTDVSYSLTGDGHMAGYFLPEDDQGFGYAGIGSITTPAGTRDVNSIQLARSDGFIDEPGAGNWLFRIKAAASTDPSNGPALWLMDFPS